MQEGLERAAAQRGDQVGQRGAERVQVGAPQLAAVDGLHGVGRRQRRPAQQRQRQGQQLRHDQQARKERVSVPRRVLQNLRKKSICRSVGKNMKF